MRLNIANQVSFIYEFRWLFKFIVLGGSVNIITGQLGNVMKESVNIAYTFARKFIEEKLVHFIIFCLLYLLKYER